MNPETFPHRKDTAYGMSPDCRCGADDAGAVGIGETWGTDCPAALREALETERARDTGPHIPPALMRRVEALGFVPGSGEPVGWLVGYVEGLAALLTTAQGERDALDKLVGDLQNEVRARIIDGLTALGVSDADYVIDGSGSDGDEIDLTSAEVDQGFSVVGEMVSDLRARVAELEATLANERGEGEPPSEGWTAKKRSGEVRWVRHSARPGRVLDVVRRMGDAPRAIVSHWWDREVDKDGDVVTTHAEGEADTMRAAMIAADAARSAGGGGS